MCGMEMTRRSAMAMMTAAGAGAAAKAEVYALIGDRYHNSDYIRT
jgi:hypothetical protein